MDILSTLIISLIEGITEFLPISSTGHMIVASKLLNLPQTNSLKAFEIIIQVSAIAAACIIYKDKLKPKNRSLLLNILVSSMPILIFGYIFRNQIPSLFSAKTVAIMFIIGGLIFILVEQKNKRSEQHPQASHNQKTSDLNNITLTQALIIGLGQTLALIPGTSRSGATIISGMLSKLDRKTSTEFSFLAAIPVIAATTLYSAIKYSDQLTQIPTLAIVLGFIVSFTTAYLSIKFLLKILENHTLIPFGIYRIVLGIIILAIIL